MFSRNATGLIVWPVAGLGTSGFDAVSGFGSAGFAFELVTPEGLLFGEPAGAFGTLAVPRAAFEPDPAPEAGLAGLAVALDVDALAGEFAAAVGTAAAGVVAALAGGTGFGVCVCFAAEAPVGV